MGTKGRKNVKKTKQDKDKKEKKKQGIKILNTNIETLNNYKALMIGIFMISAWSLGIYQGDG